VLTAILIFSILNAIFTMACAGHLNNIEKLSKVMTEAKLAEMKMWHGRN
jgi:hypothetical protein